MLMDKEPALQAIAGGSFERFGGAYKLLIHDPVGRPSREAHDEWHALFVGESAKQKLTAWDYEAKFDGIPPQSVDPSEILCLVARGDGRSWPNKLGKSEGFAHYLQTLAQWIGSGRIVCYGNIPSPSRLIRSQAVEWDVAAKEQWASWFDYAWPNVRTVGTVLEVPELLIGDESAFDFALPGDHVIGLRGLSPFGLPTVLQDALASRAFSSVRICIGKAWAESIRMDSTHSSIGEHYQQLFTAIARCKEITDAAGISLRYVQPSCVVAKSEFDALAAPELRAYALYLVQHAATAVTGEIIALPAAAWQDLEVPGYTAVRYSARTGTGIESKFRTWSPRKARTPESGQHKRSKKKVDESREYDRTQLRDKTHGHQVHRDYAAHFFRWGWAQRFCPGKKVLDTGCGQDLPLYRVLMAGKAWLPELYVGVDLNPLDEPTAKWATAYGEFNLVERYEEIVAKHGYFDIATSFEVIEHMTIPNGDEYLKAIFNCLAPGGALLISTPVFNGSKAANHIYEYTAPELKEKLERAGFIIEKRFGTFASASDIQKCATPYEKELIESLTQFYSNEVMACFLAPKYPDYARNNAWIARKP